MLLYIFEEAKDRKINFLDINIQIENNNQITTSVYRKDIDNNTTIHRYSAHPWTHKVNTYNNMINRAYQYTNNKEKLHQEINNIKRIAIENGYDNKFINKLNKKYKEKISLNNKTTLCNIKTDKRKGDKTYLTYKFTYQNIQSIIKNQKLDQQEYKYAYKPNTYIYNMIGNKNTNIDIYNLCGVYKIKCNDCNFIYIGRTHRSFKQRFSEHYKAFIHKKTRTSNIADHLITTNHQITDINCNMEIIEINKNKKDIIQLEKLYIYLHKKYNTLMNQQIIFDNDTLLQLAANMTSRNPDGSWTFLNTTL